jgi:hypothetical protein
MLFRLLLLLGIAGGLALFTTSNWLPTLTLMFLGFQTPALPLALWVLGAIAAGIATTLLLNALFNLSNYATARTVRAQMRRATRRREVQSSSASAQSYGRSTPSIDHEDADWQDWEETAVPSPPEPSRPPDRRPIKPPVDDWDADAEDDWEDFEPNDRPASQSTASTRFDGSPQPEVTPARAKSQSNLDDPQANLGSERSKSVVDADYRIIVPPYQPAKASPETEANDWFDEDDELETDEERRRRLNL